jgi:hypothetical protein
MFDKQKGYDSSEKVMRIANVADDMTQKEIDEEIERAIDTIIDNDFTHTYEKVVIRLKDIPETDTEST